jgi:hypothetical protein
MSFLSYQSSLFLTSYLRICLPSNFIDDDCTDEGVPRDYEASILWNGEPILKEKKTLGRCSSLTSLWTKLMTRLQTFYRQFTSKDCLLESRPCAIICALMSATSYMYCETSLAMYFGFFATFVGQRHSAVLAIKPLKRKMLMLLLSQSLYSLLQNSISSLLTSSRASNVLIVTFAICCLEGF